MNLYSQKIKSLNGGPFSRLGRSLSQKILHTSPPEPISPHETNTPNGGTVTVTTSRQHLQPFAKCLPRPQIKASQERLVGMYTPKYDSIQKKVPVVSFHQPKEPRPKVDLDQNESQIIISSLRKRPSVVAFSLQLPRKPLKLNDVSEGRFQYIALPELSTKVHKVRNISFIGPDRNSNNKMFNSNISGMFYPKKYDLVEKRSDKGIIPFEKYKGREDPEPKRYTYDESTYNPSTLKLRSSSKLSRMGSQQSMHLSPSRFSSVHSKDNSMRQNHSKILEKVLVNTDILKKYYYL